VDNLFYNNLRAVRAADGVAMKRFWRLYYRMFTPKTKSATILAYCRVHGVSRERKKLIEPVEIVGIPMREGNNDNQR